MLRKLLYISIVLSLVAGIILPSAVLAADNKNAKKALTSIGDEVVTSERSTTKLINKVTDKNGKETKTYQTTISSLPSHLSDLTTRIDTSWTQKTDDSGQIIFKSGDNLFTAQIVKDKVTVLDDKGKFYSWTSSIMAGEDTLTPSTPEITSDLFNSNYVNNCVVWSYGQVKKKSAVDDFFVLGNDSATIKRYIRVIEGLVQEYWVIDKDPGVDLLISVKDNKETSMDGQVSPINAYDKENKPIKVTEQFYKTSGKFYSVSEKDIKDAHFPVYIDPDMTFTSNSYDGTLANIAYGSGFTWSTLRAETIASSYGYSGTVMDVVDYNYLTGGSVHYGEIARSAVYFDTSTIPSGSNISAAYLSLYCKQVYGAGDYGTVIQSGMPTYPHSPMVVGDFVYTNYSGNLGSMGAMTAGSYNTINLGATGLSAINKTGTTKFYLIDYYDYGNISPTSNASYYGKQLYSYEMGTGYQPKLVISYSVAPIAPTVATGSATNIGTTSATLGGTLTSDGRGDPNVPEYCSANFEYGITTSYGSSSQILSGYTSGMAITINVTGLLKGTLYHFRAKSTNSAGSSYGSDATFLTLPDPPSGVSVTPGNQQNVIAWTKGSGANKTMVRVRTDTYPTSISDGTQTYFDTASTVTPTSLTAGTTYYYSLFSEITTGGLQQYSSTFAYNSGTPYTLAAPTVSTSDATNVTTTAARLNGYITSANQNSGTVSLYFEFGTSTGSYGAPVAATPATINWNEYGAVYLDKTSLSTSTPYFYRIKAVGTGGTSYGSEKTFTTGGLYAPTITTVAESGVGLTSFTMNGVVTDDGGLPAGVTVHFEYGTSGSYGTSSSSVGGLSTGSTFYFTLNNLNPSTTYHYRAVGTSTSGTGYGNDESALTNSPINPVVTTGSTSSIGATTATVIGSLVNDGGANCEVEFEYGLTTSYGSSTGWQSGKISGNDITALIEGLNIGTAYHYRAAAKNITGTSYGSDSTFTTVFGAPTNFSAKSITSTSASFSWTKNGEQTIVIMKKSGYPTDRTDGDTVYFGPDSKCSYSDLTGGNTYFFSAWSWRTGDIWTSDYAQDAITMPTVMEGETVTHKKATESLSGQSSLYQTNDTAKLQSLPFYDIINDAATSSKIPSTTMWFIVGMGLCALATVFISSLFNWNVWIIVIVALVSMWGISLTTMISFWVPLLATVLAILFIIFSRGRGGA